jgi:hypothetical protein
VKKVEKGVAVLGAGEIELRLHNDSARVWWRRGGTGVALLCLNKHNKEERGRKEEEWAGGRRGALKNVMAWPGGSHTGVRLPRRLHTASMACDWSAIPLFQSELEHVKHSFETFATSQS